jgi:D-beta-D-heptose 7-phosphate kinase / D-beta-D-heptose 1-phosphate adenosyltransferase
LIDLSLFSSCHVWVIGDLMLDEYVWGEVARISPEAPVPVLAVAREEYTLGGAGNVAANLVALGARVTVAGVVGDDRHGALLRRRFQDLEIDAGGVVVEPERPTTRKTRIVAARQQVLRIDRETPRPVAPETEAAILRRIEEGIASAGAVLVSDYGKGLLTRQMLAGIMAAARRRGKPVLVDPKGDDYSRYGGASLITPNRSEAARAAGIAIGDAESLHRAAGILHECSGVDRLVVTCGPEGMVLFEKGRAPRAIRSEARQVFDVSGAGDTVIAVLGLALAAGADWIEAAGLANAAAGIVVGKVGTATASRKELALAMGPAGADRLDKLKDIDEIEVLAAEIRKRGQRIVLTNGCFDFLHAGHLNLFSASRRLGDVLVVAIDDDESVRAIKGPGRPVIGVRERIRTLCALDAVDYVVVFSGNDLEELIDRLRPDVLTKGGNYGLDDVVGRRRVESHGGRVELIPITEGLSSRAVIESIRRAPGGGNG